MIHLSAVWFTFPQGPYVNLLLPTHLPKKGLNYLLPPNPGKQVSHPPQILRLSRLLTTSWLLILWVVGDSTWTPSLPLLAPGGGLRKLGSSHEGSPAVLALGSHWLLSPLPISLCASPFSASVLAMLLSCPPTSLIPCLPLLVSLRHLLCLRRMSRLAVCWRRWVWHSPRLGRMEMLGAGGEAGHEWPFPG